MGRDVVRKNMRAPIWPTDGVSGTIENEQAKRPRCNSGGQIAEVMRAGVVGSLCTFLCFATGEILAGVLAKSFWMSIFGFAMKVESNCGFDRKSRMVFRFQRRQVGTLHRSAWRFGGGLSATSPSITCGAREELLKR